MSNKINKPYQYTPDELAVISSNFSTHNDWSKTQFDSIKLNIISHLRSEQNNQCCYCKYPLGFDIKQVDIEHIIAKSEYEKFTFEPKNLALSCPGCNTKKSTKKVLLSPIVNYPNNSDKFKIIHAHYDNYSHHIDILEKCVFNAKTSKGSETITFCELYRLTTVEARAKVFKSKEPRLLDKLIKEINEIDNNEKNEIINTIKEWIK